MNEDKRLILQAKQAYDDGDLRQARRLLKKSKHPKAKAALKKLNEVHRTVWNRIAPFVLVFVLICLALMYMALRTNTGYFTR